MSRPPERPASLVFPAARASSRSAGRSGAYEISGGRLEELLAMGAGGLVVFGGSAEGAREFLMDVRARAGRSVQAGADLERGAGQQFNGATSLPPAALFGWLDDPALTRRAGEVTAREARALGFDWIFAPVADLASRPENPIVATRSFGASAAKAARHVAAWVEGCLAGGALPCVKHFPGHGRTLEDSHLTLPMVPTGTVRADRIALDTDLESFRAAIKAGVAGVMLAHVLYPRLDPERPATRSVPIAHKLLRERLRFDGVTFSDAFIMTAAVRARIEEGRKGEWRIGAVSETEAAVQAVASGVDVILYPGDPAAVIRAIETASEEGTLDRTRISEATRRIRQAGSRATPAGEWGRPEDRRWAYEVAFRGLHLVGRDPARGGGVEPEPREEGPAEELSVELVMIDDDGGGPFPPPPRTTLLEALRGYGIRIEPPIGEGDSPVVVALFADVRGWKGRIVPSVAAADQARAALGRALEAGRPTVLVHFGPPDGAAPILSSELKPSPQVLCAWGGEPIMQGAAAKWIAEWIRRGVPVG